MKFFSEIQLVFENLKEKFSENSWCIIVISKNTCKYAVILDNTVEIIRCRKSINRASKERFKNAKNFFDISVS